MGIVTTYYRVSNPLKRYQKCEDKNSIPKHVEWIKAKNRANRK